MDDSKEALVLTIRELSKQNEALQRRLEANLKVARREDLSPGCLGFDSKPIGPKGSTAMIQSQPQAPFKARRLCIAKECASHFRILDIRVGMRSQLLSAQPLPGAVFAVENLHTLREIDAEEQFDAAIPMEFDTAFPGVLVSVHVQRTDDSDVPFECVMTGDVLYFDKEPMPAGPLGLTKSSSSN